MSSKPPPTSPKKPSSSPSKQPSSPSKQPPSPTSDPTAPKATLPLSKSTAERKRKHLLSTLTPTERHRIEPFLPPSPPPTTNSSSTRDEPTPHQLRALQRRNNYRHQTQSRIANHQTTLVQNAVRTADAALVLQTHTPGIVEPETSLEQTTQLTQQRLRQHYLDEQTSRQIYDLHLENYGPYQFRYSRSGRHGLLFGHAGHVSLLDCHTLTSSFEFHLNQSLQDATFLHNDQLFALAQHDSLFIYDNTGTEIHKLGQHHQPLALQYLPHHHLLASINRAGILHYHDTAVGALHSTHYTRLGPCRVLRQNPQTAVLYAGHGHGSVTLWSPAQPSYLAKILVRKKGGPVTDVALHPDGTTLVTCGVEGRQIKIWDLRMLYRCTHAYRARNGIPQSLDVSQSGMLGVGHGRRVTVWSSEALNQKVKRPYMEHSLGKNLASSVRFRPFEDVCGIGHENGVSSIVIPGSGEPNLDSMECHLNPYEDKKQRREAEVKSLMEKLNPDMIGLGSMDDGGGEGGSNQVGMIESSKEVRMEMWKERKEEANRKQGESGGGKKDRKKMRGKGTATKLMQKKKKQVVIQNRDKLKDKLLEQHEKEELQTKENEDDAKEGVEPALKRFF